MTRVRLCVGEDCRYGADTESEQRRVTDGSRLCDGCRGRLTTDLRRLPGLHEECERLLGGRRTELEPRRPREPQSSVPLNTAAFELRSTMVDVLCSWSSLVAEERVVTAPRRTVADLAGFLLRHLDWLAAHDAADDLSSEVAAIVGRARRLIDPEPLRKLPVGDCVEPDCRGFLTALVRTDSQGGAKDVRCDTDPNHRWGERDWLRLSRRMRRGGSTSASATAKGPLWLSASDISRLWRVPSGSVYRLASEHSWRRRTRGRRTYYHEHDVATALRTREPRSA